MPSQKRKRSPTPAGHQSTTNDNDNDTSDVHSSREIRDEGSLFIGHFSATRNARNLQAMASASSADHRMLAWRVPSTQKTLVGARELYDLGSDEDGERWAGRKLEAVLIEQNVKGAVLVERWYGGVMLGPRRFAHIEKCARDAIAAWRSAAARGGDDAKRVRADEDQERVAKGKLVEELPRRDASIAALRGLLEEKIKGKDASRKADEVENLPAKAVDYSKMDIAVLRRLEKARDSTIAVLLKKIGEAEAAAKLQSEEYHNNET